MLELDDIKEYPSILILFKEVVIVKRFFSSFFEVENSYPPEQVHIPN